MITWQDIYDEYDPVEFYGDFGEDGEDYDDFLESGEFEYRVLVEAISDFLYSTGAYSRESYPWIAEKSDWGKSNMHDVIYNLIENRDAALPNALRDSERYLTDNDAARERLAVLVEELSAYYPKEKSKSNKDVER